MKKKERNGKKKKERERGQNSLDLLSVEKKKRRRKKKPSFNEKCPDGIIILKFTRQQQQRSCVVRSHKIQEKKCFQ
jgi:hypothetical protein